MSLSASKFILSNGNAIPAVALGIGAKHFKHGHNELDRQLIGTLELALKGGITHIEGAGSYGTNEEIGMALKNSMVKRNEVFITAEYFPSEDKHLKHHNPYEELKANLKDLGLTYVDLYLLHQEVSNGGPALLKQWSHMERLKDEGFAHSVGVSNFGIEDLKQLLNSKTKWKPVVNQIEFNHYLHDDTPGIAEFCQEQGILVEAYAVVIQKGLLPITTTSKEENMEDIVGVVNFELEEEDVEQITQVARKRIHFK
ncbi:hypothetical protein CANMA_004495 [Candida margitis]|uniref:uncharacterized protein n=1 Tax=Candida margitis TaxID=1775924 RepID=UPI002226AA6C|nr:uncharacterized protein CANMA_004495 [Candida margitis]KAI5956658.1 hypothetical protein CANMA_004495 [Candida margitis]